MNQQVIKLLIALIGGFLFFLGVDCLPKRKNKGQTVKKGIIEEIDSGNCSTDDTYTIYVTVDNKKFIFYSAGMTLYKEGEEVDVQITGNKKILGSKRMKNIGIRLIFLGLVMIFLLIILQKFNWNS